MGINEFMMAVDRAERHRRERDEALNKLDDQERKDLDETRRLLYGALAAGRAHADGSWSAR